MRSTAGAASTIVDPRLGTSPDGALSEPSAEPATVSDSSPTVIRPIGALLGWLFPGLGQIAAGNVRRGLFAMTGILVLFLSGVLVGGIDSVDYREDRLWFYGQAGCGPIAFAAGFANESLLKSGSAAPMVDMPAPPGAPRVTASVFPCRRCGCRGCCSCCSR